MKAYLIDPGSRVICEIAVPRKRDELRAEMCRLIGAEDIDLDHIGGGGDYDVPDVLYSEQQYDAISRGEPIHAFKLRVVVLGHSSTDEIRVGNAIVIGTTNLCPPIPRVRNPRTPIELLRRDVVWLGKVIPKVTWEPPVDDEQSEPVVTYMSEQ